MKSRLIQWEFRLATEFRAQPLGVTTKRPVRS